VLDKVAVNDAIEAALSAGGDFAELFVESKEGSSVSALNGIVEKASWGVSYGCGIRVFSGYGAVYTYTSDTSRENLIKCAIETSQAAAGENRAKWGREFSRLEGGSLHPIKIYPASRGKSEYADRLRLAMDAARAVSDKVTQVGASYSSYTQDVLIANSDGLWATDQRTRTRVMVESIASSEGEKQTSHQAPGAHKGLEFFDELDLREMGESTATAACLMLSADLCPSGQMPVIIDNAFGGVIFHEACGHSLEATQVARRSSVFTDCLGKPIASEIVTAVDDGTMPNEWGSLNIDDEGEKARKTVLIENGILKSYMVDKLNGLRMGMPATGSSRRESYAYAPTSRMTNTYIAAGSDSVDEIIGSTEYGLYAKKMGGGSVQPATGDFNFAVLEAYMVRGGKIAEPVRGATLIGRGCEVLMSIDRVGRNLSLGQGICGSISGSVATSVGQPMIRVKKLTVGGRR
jgi:TldD protein